MWFIAVLIIVICIAIVAVLAASPRRKRKIRIDGSTPQEAFDKFKDKGLDLIYSTEMNDFSSFKKDWLIVDEPLGTQGISDNFSYAPENVQIGQNGLELHLKMNQNWKDCFDAAGKFNPDDQLLGKALTSGKVTGVKGVRFKYGVIEAKIKCPSLQGIWPAFWLNFGSGSLGVKYANNDPTTPPIGVEWKSVLPEYPFLNSNFWPPEIDILEITNNNYNTWQNQSSVHTPNQYDGDAQYYTFTQGQKQNPYRWCPTGIVNGINEDGSYIYRSVPTDASPPTYTSCFGVSQFAEYKNSGGGQSTSHDDWHTYRAEWYPNKVDFYLDDKFYGTITDRDLVPTNSGAMRTVVIPDVPMFPIINLAAAQSWAQGMGPLSDPINFVRGEVKDPTAFRDSPMEIAYVRIYQDKDGSGLNPDSDESALNVIKNQTFGQEYPLYYNTEPLLDTIKNSSSEEKTAAMDVAFGELNNYLQIIHKDNYCLSVDAASLWNYGGSGFNSGFSAAGYSPDQIMRLKRLNSVLFYIMSRYGVGVRLNKSGLQFDSVPDLKLPKKILRTWYWQNYGWPARRLNPEAPCEGTQTTWGSRLDQLKCVEK